MGRRGGVRGEGLIHVVLLSCYCVIPCQHCMGMPSPRHLYYVVCIRFVCRTLRTSVVSGLCATVWFALLIVWVLSYVSYNMYVTQHLRALSLVLLPAYSRPGPSWPCCQLFPAEAWRLAAWRNVVTSKLQWQISWMSWCWAFVCVYLCGVTAN